MSIEPSDILLAVIVGFGATFVMDAVNIVLKHLFDVPAPNYCLVGRWLRYMPEGTFRHDNIGAVPRKSAECAVGWIAHYLLGADFALGLVLASPRWLHEPTLLPAMIMGIVTVVIPYFVMQPALGLGIAASKAPNPTQARLRSLVNHAVFGLGLYVSALALNQVIRTTA